MKTSYFLILITTFSCLFKNLQHQNLIESLELTTNMPSRKRKLFTGNKPLGQQNTAVKSRRVARKITSNYHLIQSEISQLKEKGEEGIRLAELEGALEENGGINRYQQASVISTSHFKTSRWIIRSLSQVRTCLSVLHLPVASPKRLIIATFQYHPLARVI